MTSRTRLNMQRVHIGLGAMAGSAGLGQVAVLVATPLLARIYSPESFGIFAVVVSFVTIAATAGSLRLETAVPIASTSDARNLVRIASLAALAAGFACLFCLWAVAHDAVRELTVLDAVLVVVLVWATAMYAVLSAVSLRERRYGAVARRNLLQQSGTACGQLAMSLPAPTATGLLAGLAVGRSLSVGSLAVEFRNLRRPDQPAIRMWETLRRFWRFPCLFAPAALLNVLGLQIPILLVTRLYGADASGNLSQAMALTLLPAAVVGGAASSVVVGEMAIRVRDGQTHQRRTYLRITRALAPIALLWLVVLVFAAPVFLPIILGPQWTTAGQFAAVLSVAAACQLVAAPLSAVLPMYQRSWSNLALDVARILLVLGAGLLAYATGQGAVATVLSMSIAMGSIYAITWFVGLRVVSDPTTRLAAMDLRHRLAAGVPASDADDVSVDERSPRQ